MHPPGILPAAENPVRRRCGSVHTRPACPHAGEEGTLMSQELDAQTRAAERAERAERMAREGAEAMAEHLASIKARDERTVQLRAMRLAKEAAEAEEKARVAAATPPKTRKRS